MKVWFKKCLIILMCIPINGGFFSLLSVWRAANLIPSNSFSTDPFSHKYTIFWHREFNFGSFWSVEVVLFLSGTGIASADSLIVLCAILLTKKRDIDLTTVELFEVMCIRLDVIVQRLEVFMKFIGSQCYLHHMYARSKYIYLCQSRPIMMQWSNMQRHYFGLLKLRRSFEPTKGSQSFPNLDVSIFSFAWNF